MADDSEVFDFASDEFTKTDLVNALNEMVIEYKKLSDSFNEMNLKNKSDSTSFQTIQSDILKNQVTELSTENKKLKATV